MRKFWLAIALSLPCSVPAVVAYDLSDLKKLEELEQLEKLQRLQQLQQEENKPSYYVKLYAGRSSCVPSELDFSGLDNDPNLRILTEMINVANEYAHSPIFGLSLGMYCTRSLMLELSLSYMQHMIFGCDVSMNTPRGLIKFTNLPMGAFVKAIADLTESSFPSTSAAGKLYWDMCSGKLGSLFVTGGLCIQYVQMQEKVFLPGGIVGVGAAINITESVSLNGEINCTYLSGSFSSLLSNDSFKIESWYGYNMLLGIKYNF
ncbi:hypothetical protein [Orientia tsutsugamushi]|nr:hypothetical protein [Orientia tsutsugamushi]